MEFAKDFFAVEPPDRYTWLHDRVSSYLLENGADTLDMTDVIDFISNLEDVVV